jgi:leucyl aminopeptidase (aminopeptidase T)
MEVIKPNVGTREYYWIELGVIARRIVVEIFPITRGENVVITADTKSDWRAVEVITQAIYQVGAVPIIVLHPTTPEVCSDPPDPILPILKAADAWIEMNGSWLLYSDTWREAMEAGVKALVLGVYDLDDMIRLYGCSDYSVIRKLGSRLVALATQGKRIQVKTRRGTDFTFLVREEPDKGDRIVLGKGTTQVPPGQTELPGLEHDSIEGRIAFDAALNPPESGGVLHSPVVVDVRQGRIVNIDGGVEARSFESWLSRYDHPLVREIDHINFGFNPGVNSVKGSVAVDERVFGCSQIGIGRARLGAPVHCDGTILAPSIWAGEIQLEEEGKYVYPELVALCQRLQVVGY